MEWFGRAISKYAVWVVGFAFALTVVAANQLFDFQSRELRLRFDPSADRLLPEGDASRTFYDRIRRLFGSDETLLIALVSDDIFSTDTLRQIDRLTHRLAQVDGVHHVLSLTNAVNVRGVGDDLEIAPFVTQIPETTEALSELRNEVLGNPIYGGNLVSPDGRATALLVYFADMTNQEYLEAGIDQQIVQIAEEDRGDAQVWITGGPHIRAESVRVFRGELVKIPMLILGVLGVVLIFSFRNVRGVILPLLTIAVSVVWTLGLAAWLGYELNAVTALVPALLTTLGLSYSVHVVAEHDESAAEQPTAGPRERTAKALTDVSLPVCLTGLTTAAGFASLGLSPLGAVREFGFLAVIGVISAAGASLTVTPALLCLIPDFGGRAAPRDRRGLGFDRFVQRVARFDVVWRRPIFMVAFGVFAIALLGIFELRIGTQQVSKFREDAPVRTHFEAVNEHLEGANLFYVVLETEYPEGFKEPVNMAQIEWLQEWLELQPEIGGTTSLVDYVKLLNRGFHGNDPAFLAIPESKRMTSQLLFFGGSDELDSLVDSRFQIASIRVRANVVDSDAVAALALRIEERLDDLPTHLDASLTGTSIVFTRTLDAIIRGQATSMVMALGIIYLILAAMFVSLRIGFIALIPNVLPVVVYFGALGWMGIRLDPGMSLIAPMVLGIAVDDTIHYFARFIREAKRLGDEDRATASALRSVGRPVTYTSAALCLGFLMLNFSELRSNAQLGSMAAFALAFAWLTDFTLTPALCVKLRIATLWDFLRLDLGRDPQRSIALFEGMRAGQARMVALMATLMEVRAGQRLFNVGEPGDALYVVIQGRLTAHIGQGDSTTELAVHRRGGVLGEVGLFREQRIANVDVAEDAKLLRLTQESVAQLARQRPKTAALVFRNLNGLLAQRIAKLTDREVLDNAGPAEQTLDREALASQADALQQSFFTAEAEGFREQLRGLGTEASSEAGAVSSQIAYLGIDPDTLAALTLLPLVEVAWADGEMDDGEKRAVLTAAATAGIEPGSASYGLLEIWLEEPPKPDLRAAWVDYIRAICSELSVEGRMRLQSVIIGMARNVAEAAGGFLGFGSVSRAEERVLAELESAFQDS